MQIGAKKYEIRVRVTDPRTGKRKGVRREFAGTLKEAKTEQENLRQELRESLRVPDPTDYPTLATFVPSWLAGREGRIKKSTATKIASVWELHLRPTGLATTPIDAITPFDIERWLEGQRKKTYRPGKGKASKRTGEPRPYSETSISGHYRVLRTILRKATGRHQLRNPCDGVDEDVIPVPEPRDDNFLTAGELRKVLEWIEGNVPEWYAGALLDVTTGLRWGELSALRWEDVEHERGVITVSRGNYKGTVVEGLKTDRAKSRRRKPKVVPLLPAVAEALRAHRRRMMEDQHPGLAAGWIFPNLEGGLHRGSPLLKILRRACEATSTGRRVTVHGLRHTANDLIRRVATGEVTRAITGHSTERMTHHYAHVDEGEKFAAAARAFEAFAGLKGSEEGSAAETEPGVEF